MEKFVTIAIPTFNRAQSYLSQSIESAIAQTYENIEIIISDNCSDDNTEAVVKSFKDSRIRYFRQNNNIGPYKNFNFCLQKAKGDYFLILSDDDLIDLDFIETCMSAVNNSNNIGIVRTGTRVIDSHGNVVSKRENDVVGLPIDEFFRGWFANKTALYPVSTLFNTKKILEIGGFGPENNLFHDGFVITELAAKYGRVDIKKIKASFRKHSNEITFAVNVKDWCRDSLLLLDSMCKMVPEESRNTVKEEGMQFFIRINYNRTKKIKSMLKRFATYLLVYKTFKFTEVPPPVKNVLSKGHFLQLSKFIK